MILDLIVDQITMIKHQLSNKEIIVFGTEKVARLVYFVLFGYSLEIHYFVDNNKSKWGTKFLEIDVKNPEELIKKSNKEFVVIIASSYHKEISRQLEEYGLSEGINYFVIYKVEKNNGQLDILSDLIEIGIRETKPKYIMFGDSVMSTVSPKDIDKTLLSSMIQKKVGSNIKIREMHYWAFHPGVFYVIFHMLKYLKCLPETIILPINIRAFSPQWDYNPDFQHTEKIHTLKTYLKDNGYDIGELYGTDIKETFDNFIKYRAKYALIGERTNGEFYSWVQRQTTKDDYEWFERYKQIFCWHYLYEFKETNRKFMLLKKLIEEINDNNIHLITYVTPINYVAAEKFVGEEFNKYVNIKVKMISDMVSELNSSLIDFSDFSFLLRSDCFVHNNDTTEHLNEKGRKILSRTIGEILIKRH